MDKPRLWTRDFILFAVANLFVGLLFYLLMTTMAVYAVEQFRASQSKAGLASGIFIIGAIFSWLLAGRYLEVIGRRRLLLTSLIFYVLITLLYFWVNDINLLLLVRFLHGAAFGSANTAMATAVMGLIPDERRGEGTGYYSLSATFATAVGPFLGIHLANAYGFDAVLAVCTGVTFASLAIMLFCNIPETNLAKEQISCRSSIHMPSRSVWRRRPAISSRSIPCFCFCPGRSPADCWTGQGDNVVMISGILIFALSLLIIGLPRSGSILLAAGALMAFGFGPLMSSAQAIAVKVSRAIGSAWLPRRFYIWMDTGVGIGPYLIGLIVPHVHFRGMYGILAALVFLAVFLYFGPHGRKVAVSPGIQAELTVIKKQKTASATPAGRQRKTAVALPVFEAGQQSAPVNFSFSASSHRK